MGTHHKTGIIEARIQDFEVKTLGKNEHNRGESRR